MHESSPASCFFVLISNFTCWEWTLHKSEFFLEEWVFLEYPCDHQMMWFVLLVQFSYGIWWLVCLSSIGQSSFWCFLQQYQTSLHWEHLNEIEINMTEHSNDDFPLHTSLYHYHYRIPNSDYITKSTFSFWMHFQTSPSE